ncbi:reverse transcriptase domain-containing protein [Candidatus Amarolinea aalborgensis]|uniref:reverse transcriptase domain-containing protein n=1 Tax=Candidatus Amarolinea aalborgensis TaxID=2249329 RepID=UPI003BF9D98B
MDPTRGMRRVFKRLEARDARRQAREGTVETTSAAARKDAPVEPGLEPGAPRAVDSTPADEGGAGTGVTRPKPRFAPRPPPTRQKPRSGRSAGAVFNDLAAARRQTANRLRLDHKPHAASAGAPRAVKPGEPAASKTPGLEEAFTPANLARAWLHIKANGGGPGVDGVSLDDFAAHADAELTALRQDVLGGAYRPTPVKTVWVPKRSGEGQRPLAKWTIRDRVAQRAVVEYLEPTFEQRFLDCSFGFRPGRGVQDAAARILALRDQGLRWVVDADIKKCFERVDPDLLIKRLRSELDDPGLLWLLEGWIRVRIMNALVGQRPTAGTSQGGPISPLLANIYLHPLDVRLTQAKLNLVRYADDLVVLCARRQDAEAALAQVEQGLRELRLELNPNKTRLVSFDEGFQFLGVFFIGNKHHVLGF